MCHHALLNFMTFNSLTFILIHFELLFIYNMRYRFKVILLPSTISHKVYFFPFNEFFTLLKTNQADTYLFLDSQFYHINLLAHLYTSSMLLLWFFNFWDRRIVCNTGWPQNFCVVKASLASWSSYLYLHIKGVIDVYLNALLTVQYCLYCYSFIEKFEIGTHETSSVLLSQCRCYSESLGFLN